MSGQFGHPEVPRSKCFHSVERTRVPFAHPNKRAVLKVAEPTKRGMGSITSIVIFHDATKAIPRATAQLTKFSNIRPVYSPVVAFTFAASVARRESRVPTELSSSSKKSGVLPHKGRKKTSRRSRVVNFSPIMLNRLV